MALHLLKLCVGADSIDDLRDWVAERCLVAVAAGLEPHSSHVTRMVPKRMEELLDGGSLYWIIKGQLSARQKLLDIKTFTGGDGITRCELILGPEVIEVAPAPRRPFQGWRYLDADVAPRDLAASGADIEDMPDDLKRELAELGLL
ncbi:MAG: DUF1489 family protein [Alphaproteobacteria bacterium]|jgi:hypothetical protein|uniref:DUF1489 family protein n=1 Tax=Rhizobium/Agrobacterium group TaxID=227290 RepID=UPI0006B8BE30|nr:MULTISPECIES: DUF1489 family protein [Rhizobium/Agrobacterium group]MBU0739812.1 DUF1489 family protein [Alphaproteobacteria bacterium]AOG11533.1 hypothetical protein BSY240_494 [Agrobacterium sp. RAC06]KPF58017.1 hypothetical protein IP85_10715 [Rhizobium sp. AAP116]MBU0834740.1 DUF1489 family protein [Alphaproteobacteria bacterium]MBU1763571.1 DUF1489 family protein [Alphaproteobacteria bacterium]